MNWKDIVQKNKNKSVESKNNEHDSCQNEEVIDQSSSIYDDYSSYFKDIDEEFDYLYYRRISSLKEAFKELIERQALPFLNDEHTNLDYTFYDFIKDSSINYDNIKRDVDEYNYDVEKEIKEENIKLDIELKEEHDYFR